MLHIQKLTNQNIFLLQQLIEIDHLLHTTQTIQNLNLDLLILILEH